MKQFTLLLKPSAADCDFRCRYCYYLERPVRFDNNSHRRMNRKTLERVISSYMETKQPVYGFLWQGGEPLLMGSDFFEKVTAMQKLHGEKGSVISNYLQTNGANITDKLASHLSRYRFLTGVSLDGPQYIHDAMRIDLSGKGTFNKVINGIEILKKHNADFNVISVISKSNHDKASVIYDYFCKMGFFFQQYIECVEADDNGNLKSFSITGKEWGYFLCELYDSWFRDGIGKISIRLFDSIITKLITGESNTCQFGRSCNNYFVVDYNGDIYPCDFYVYPEMKIGNIMEKGWNDMMESSLYKSFNDRKTLLDRECLECKYLNLCAGDCPKNRLCRGKDDINHSLLCEGWKMFYDYALPGLRKIADYYKENFRKNNQ